MDLHNCRLHLNFACLGIHVAALSRALRLDLFAFVGVPRHVDLKGKLLHVRYLRRVVLLLELELQLSANNLLPDVASLDVGDELLIARCKLLHSDGFE